MFLEEHLIFFPDRYPVGDWSPHGLDLEDISFRSEDGTKLHGWYVEAPHHRAQVLYLHGNAGNLTDRAYLLELLPAALDVSVFLIDYRGYGKSQGSPDEAGIRADARAARAWLAERAGIAQSQVVLMGRSLGGALAVDLAADERARLLILESTFTSMPDVAAYHYPLLPVRWLLRTRLNSLSKIARCRGPLIQSHGTADDIIPFQLGRQLFEAATCEKQFLAIENAGHNDPQPREFYAALDRLLDKL